MQICVKWKSSEHNLFFWQSKYAVLTLIACYIVKDFNTTKNVNLILNDTVTQIENLTSKRLNQKSMQATGKWKWNSKSNTSLF